MKTHEKLKSWLVDYGYMLRGTAAMIIHRDPPAHYLGYQLEGKVPVVLVPGILGKWSFMKKVADQISLQGHPVYIVPHLGYNLSDIKSAVKTVRALVVQVFPKLGHVLPHIQKGAHSVRDLLTKQNLGGVVLVAHSKGGLIGKYLLAHDNGDGRVLGMVSIATPYSGSAMAKLIPHDAFKELLNDSKIIIDLEKHTEVNKKIISIIPEYDNHVWAEKGSFLDGALQNIEIAVHGHHKVLFDKKVIDATLGAIDKIEKLGK